MQSCVPEILALRCQEWKVGGWGESGYVMRPDRLSQTKSCICSRWLGRGSAGSLLDHSLSLS